MRPSLLRALIYGLLIAGSITAEFSCYPGTPLRALLMILVLASGFVLTYCGSDGSGSESTDNSEEIDEGLVQTLNTPGGVIQLESTGGSLDATVVDANGDSTGDGIDLNGDSEADLIYVGGALDVKTGGLLGRTLGFAFYFAGDPNKTVYYFVLIDGELKIRRQQDGSGSDVAFVVEDNTITGLDTTGDGTVDTGSDFLDDIVPVFSEGFALSLDVKGLTGSVDIKVNGNPFTITSNGIVNLAEGLGNGASFAISVVGASNAETLCILSEKSGSISGANVVVKLSCSTGWVQDAYAKASNAASLSDFGNAVAIDGNTMVIGAFREDHTTTNINNNDGAPGPSASAGNGQGAVYVFKRNGNGNWVQDAYLKGSNSSADYSYFGQTVAISGDTIAVGAPGDGPGGSLYVFKRNANGNWVEDAYVQASNSESGDELGLTAIAIDDNLIAVSSILEDNASNTIVNNDNANITDIPSGNSNIGAVYLFKRNTSGNWVQDAYLKPSNADDSLYFGQSVAVSGNLVAVGSGADANGQSTISNADGQPTSLSSSDPYSGAVWMFKRNSAGNWIQDAYIKAPNNYAASEFGRAIDLDGDSLLVGSPVEGNTAFGIVNTDSATIESSNGDKYSGSAYIFKRNTGGHWLLDAYIKPSNNYYNNYFGISVALDGDIAAVGAQGAEGDISSILNDDSANIGNNFGPSSQGAVYVFKRRSNGNWKRDAYIKATNSGSGDNFASSISISGDTIVSGARSEENLDAGIVNQDNVPITDGSTGTSVGAAYIFRRK